MYNKCINVNNNNRLLFYYTITTLIFSGGGATYTFDFASGCYFNINKTHAEIYNFMYVER